VLEDDLTPSEIACSTLSKASRELGLHLARSLFASLRCNVSDQRRFGSVHVTVASVSNATTKTIKTSQPKTIMFRGSAHMTDGRFRISMQMALPI
jgi:hypothetical protein